MHTLIVFAAVLAAAFAEQIVSVSQDTLGNYNLKYAIEGISRVENRDIHGNVNGGYSYIDPYGILRKTEFTSGVHGYNAVGTDIPVPVHDTPEVASAKAAHLNALHAAYLSAPQQPLEFLAPQQPLEFLAPAAAPLNFAHAAPLNFAHAAPVSVPYHSFVQPGAIPDTPEVLAARAQHFAAHAAAGGHHHQF